MDYAPAVAGGAYSTGVFYAKGTDPKMQIFGRTTNGIFDVDTEYYKTSITVERFPADVLPASGSDGHADIVDEISGVIHSFWQLKMDADGVWRAQQYAWAPLKGRGWGNGAHYFQGARAAR